MHLKTGNEKKRTCLKFILRDGTLNLVWLEETEGKYHAKWTGQSKKNTYCIWFWSYEMFRIGKSNEKERLLVP